MRVILALAMEFVIQISMLEIVSSLFTCEISYPGLCVPDTMACIDPHGLIDSGNPVLNALPSQSINVSCSVWDIPSVPVVTATDNDPCFESVVTYKEWTDVEQPTCKSSTIWRKWETTDPQEKKAAFTQEIIRQADESAPEWDEFPEDKMLLFAHSGDEGSLSPDYTGWPTFIEACQPGVVVKYEDTVSTDIAFRGEKLVQRIWTVTNECDNSNSRTQMIHIVTITTIGSKRAL